MRAWVLVVMCLSSIGVCCQAKPSEVRTMVLTAQSGPANPELVRQIAKTSEAVSGLLAIAVTPGTEPDNKHTAIEELSKIKTPESREALAQILVPHQPLGMRQEVAAALLDSPCLAKCTRWVLSYLYRVSQGERNRLETGKIISPEMQREFAVDETKVIESLYQTLSQHKFETLDALVTVYGVGTEQPSQFGLQVAKRLSLRESCSYLIRSEQALKVLKAGGQGDPTETTQTIDAIGCR